MIKQTDLDLLLDGFALDHAYLADPVQAEGSCFEITLKLLSMLPRLSGTGRILRFQDGKPDGFYPVAMTRRPNYDGDHLIALIFLEDEAQINVDFTARQFNPEIPLPFIFQFSSTV